MEKEAMTIERRDFLKSAMVRRLLMADEIVELLEEFKRLEGEDNKTEMCPQCGMHRCTANALKCTGCWAH